VGTRVELVYTALQAAA